jgi:Galactose oxidase, central domain/Kelch motif
MKIQNLKLLLVLFLFNLYLFGSTHVVQALPPGAWQQTENMFLPRSKHTATLLPDGTVLVAGGLTGSLGNIVTTSSAEIYHPDSRTWSLTSSMSVPRSRFTATLLPNDKVVVAGGSNNGFATATAELYDFTTGLWTRTGNMNIPRLYHTATLLNDGRVLVTGGQSAGDGNDNFVEKTGEIYDPGTGKWTLVDSMSRARYGHTASLLPDGTALIVGGAGPRGDLVYTVRAEMFDPHSGLWKNVDALATPWGFHTAVLLNNGNVLVAGGLTLPANSPNRTTTAELFQTSSSKWVFTGSMAVPRSAGAYGGALFPDGRFFIAGGRTDTAELYNPITGIWELLSNMTVSRSFHTVTLLLDGSVLVSGGENANGFIATAEIYPP